MARILTAVATVAGERGSGMAQVYEAACQRNGADERNETTSV